MKLFRSRLPGLPQSRIAASDTSRTHRKRTSVRRLACSSRERLFAERLEGRAMLATILQVESLLPANTAVGIGATIPFQVQYDQPVTVSGTPLAYVNVQKPGNTQAIATFTGVTGLGTILNFSYTVAAGDVTLGGQSPIPARLPRPIGPSRRAMSRSPT